MQEAFWLQPHLAIEEVYIWNSGIDHGDANTTIPEFHPGIRT